MSAPPLLLTALIANAAASSTGPSWQVSLAEALHEADPNAGWVLAPVQAAALQKRTLADIICDIGEASASASWHGPGVLTQGSVIAGSADGRQVVLLAPDALICDATGGCAWLPALDEAAIDLPGEASGTCVWPVCGGVVQSLVGTHPLYVVADVQTRRDGSTSFLVTDLLVAFDAAVTGVEPDEIDGRP